MSRLRPSASQVTPARRLYRLPLPCDLPYAAGDVGLGALVVRVLEDLLVRPYSTSTPVRVSLLLSVSTEKKAVRVADPRGLLHVVRDDDDGVPPARGLRQSNRPAVLYQAGMRDALHGGHRPYITSPHGLATAKGLVMAEAIAERVRRYILDGSDEDLRRLLGLAETTQEMARSAFRRVGVQEGWHAIDCGCGPIGGLAVMAEMVGPAGRVVGVDFSEPAVKRARSVVAALQLGNVEVFAGDIHELDAAAVGGPFDLAYTRFFLMHQPDPVRTLSQIARLLRPGGWVVTQEALRNPPPRSHPHHDALGAYWDLVYQLLERAAGVPNAAVDDLAESARAAGLEVVATDGSFATIGPELGFDLHAATLLAARERAIASGVADAQQIDTLVSDLRAAKDGGYQWVSTPFVMDLTLRKPVAA